MTGERTMMLSWDERGTLVPFSSVEELDQLLDGVRAEAAQNDQPVVVTVLDADDPDGPALSIGCGGSLSVAVWRTPEETAALLSCGDDDASGPAEFTFCGEPTKYPSSALVDNEFARAAMRAFVTSGTRPEEVRWQAPA